MTNCHILLNVAVALIVVIVGIGRGEELEPIPNLVEEEEESHVVEKLPLPPPEHEDGRCRCVCPRLSALLSEHYSQKPPFPGVNASSLSSSSTSLAMNRQVYVRAESAEAECNCESVVMSTLAETHALKLFDYVEDSSLSLTAGTVCPRCTCKYATRNTTMIKVVVIMVIWVIGALTLYMGILMLLDSWYRKGRTALAAGSRWNYQEQTNEGPVSATEGDDASTSSPAAGGDAEIVVGEVNMVTLRPSSSSEAGGGGGGGVLHRVGNQQSKWQKTVMEQRRNIYDRRTILN